MQASQIPAYFNIPFANNAGATYINPIPQASQIGITAGAASLTDGFPPDTFLPVGAGGTPPWGRDFNGLLNQITAWNRWVGAGNPTKFNAAFSAAVGGYPQGAFLASMTAGNAWVSVADNNTIDPDATAGAPGWLGVAFITPIQNGSYISADDTGSVNALVASPQPAPLALSKYQRFQIKVANANTVTNPTLNITGISGLLGAATIVRPNGSALAINDLVAGMIGEFVYDGLFFQLINPANVTSPSPALRMLDLSGSGQTVQAQVLTKVTCYSTINQNTLVTSTWDGQNLTIGAGESGLWSITHNAAYGNGVPVFFTYISRTRGSAVKWFYCETPTFIGIPVPVTSFTTQIMDLQVNDVVNFYVFAYIFPTSSGTLAPLNQNLPSGVMSNVTAYRLSGLAGY